MRIALGVCAGVALGLALLTTGCQWSDLLPTTAEEDFGPLTTTATDVEALVIDWYEGEINVTFDPNATEISASGRKYANALTQELADAGLDDIEIGWTNSSATATLLFDLPTLRAMNYMADVDVTVPAGLTLTITSVGGDITVTGNTGTTAIDVFAGDVTVTGQTGDVTINATTGETTVGSTAGDVDVASGGSIHINSSGGNVTVRGDGKPIGVIARPAADGFIDITNSEGSIELHIPATFAATLELNVEVAGDIKATLTPFSVVDLQSTAHKLTATLNGGGGTITAETSTGDVIFMALPVDEFRPD